VLEVLARRRDVPLAVVALLGHQRLDLLVLARVERGEREVLELPLDRVDAQPVGDRSVDLERLARLVDLLGLRQRAERAHVVEAVGQLDQDHPDVRGHRHDHLAVVLGLGLVARGERDLGQLGDAVDEARDLLAEAVTHLAERGRRVLDGVMQQCRAERLGVQAHPGADPGHADRVHDEVLARLAPLVGVMLAGEQERVGHAPAVDLDDRLVGVLVDDREEVGQELLLDGRELARGRLLARRFGVWAAIDHPGCDAVVAVGVGGRQHHGRRRRRRGFIRAVGRLRGGTLRLQAAATARAALFARNCRPSSSRRW
jgi:hypothetical protein